ncbi:hypothetical protein RJ639_046926 [Escallonia herrerae]|uniref:Uncharacterized protein n=1 Tax=Escallonia herrerae TaxID=1293975 RepID=A0AA88W3Q7_9ASTE|nr:hypothetical protein RJ639_046926 [Escallonia herrerae]
MEEKSITVVTNNVVADTTVRTAEKWTINGQKKKKKKRGAFSLLKAALFILRQKPGEKSKRVQLEVASSGNWKKMLGSMRPLHLQDNPSPPPPSVVVSIEQFEDVLPPASPAPSTSSAGTMSQYASANNLQELDKHEESDDEDDETDKEFDDKAGDEMIDAKAEEFIAHFYEQMRLQHHRTRGKRRE